MLNRSKVIFTAALLSSGLILNACTDNGLPDEFVEAIDLVNDKWDTGCLENPIPADNPDAAVGYVLETFEIRSFTAIQTFEYFQDADCTVPVTESQVANVDETFFLSKQSQRWSVGYPTGKTMTELGEAYHLNLQAVSISIDGVVQNDEQLLESGIELVDLLAVYIITDSDRLHLSAAADARPDSVPLDYFYNRSVD